MKCNIIGAGRLGKNIAESLYRVQIISSLFICNRSFESAQKACEEINFGLAKPEIMNLPEADITWICSNDDAVPEIVTALNRQSALKEESLVIHCSGVLSSAVLEPLRKKGCSIASFHPLKAFKTNYLDSKAFNQVDCILEGDPAACDWLHSTFSNLGAYVTSIKPEHKTIYHAAACMASNYLITLAACSEELFLKAGLEPLQSRRMLLNLMQGNVTNLGQVSNIAQALTGPITRGDINTLSLHLKALEDPCIEGLYKAATLASLSLTQLSEEQKNIIKNLCFTGNIGPNK